MRELFAFGIALLGPLVESPRIRERVEFIEDNFFSLGASAALALAFIMWANI